MQTFSLPVHDLIVRHSLFFLHSRMENKEKGEDMDLAKDEAGNTESDEEEKANVTGNGEKPTKKGNRGPRKIFKWTPEIRQVQINKLSGIYLNHDYFVGKKMKILGGLGC